MSKTIVIIDDNNLVVDSFICESLSLAKELFPNKTLIECSDKTGCIFEKGSLFTDNKFTASKKPFDSFIAKQDGELFDWFAPKPYLEEIPEGFTPSWNEEKLDWELLEQ